MIKILILVLAFFGAFALAVSWGHLSNTAGLLCGGGAVIMGLGLSAGGKKR